MKLRTLTATSFAALDRELMSDAGAYSLDQLMELAGLAVAQAVHKLFPPAPSGTHHKVLVACGPGNNGGDGLVAARHLLHFGYRPTIYYPKPSKNELHIRLSKQLVNLSIPSTSDISFAINEADCIVDAIFGAQFTGAVRAPFEDVIVAMRDCKKPILAVDAPSGWDIESGPPDTGCAAGYAPTALISLTAPKPLVKYFEGRHFVGGRFLSKDVAERYKIDVPAYPGTDQILEVPVSEVE